VTDLKEEEEEETGSTQQNYNKLGWKSLEERRLQSKLCTFQKARLNLIDLNLHEIPTKTRATRQGEKGSFFRPYSPVNVHFFSFFHQTPILWNSLPPATPLKLFLQG